MEGHISTIVRDLVKLNLEYRVQFVSPHFKKHKFRLQEVPRRTSGLMRVTKARHAREDWEHMVCSAWQKKS